MLKILVPSFNKSILKDNILKLKSIESYNGKLNFHIVEKEQLSEGIIDLNYYYDKELELFLCVDIKVDSMQFYLSRDFNNVLLWTSDFRKTKEKIDDILDEINYFDDYLKSNFSNDSYFNPELTNLKLTYKKNTFYLINNDTKELEFSSNLEVELYMKTNKDKDINNIIPKKLYHIFKVSKYKSDNIITFANENGDFINTNNLKIEFGNVNDATYYSIDYFLYMYKQKQFEKLDLAINMNNQEICFDLHNDNRIIIEINNKKYYSYVKKGIIYLSSKISNKISKFSEDCMIKIVDYLSIRFSNIPQFKIYGTTKSGNYFYGDLLTKIEEEKATRAKLEKDKLIIINELQENNQNILKENDFLKSQQSKYKMQLKIIKAFNNANVNPNKDGILIDILNDEINTNCFNRQTNNRFEYNNSYSNELYFDDYKEYRTIDNNYLNKTLNNQILNHCRNEINLLFVGCGHFYEIYYTLTILNDFQFNDKIINIMCLDMCLWPTNYINHLREFSKNFSKLSIWFYQINFLDEFINHSIDYINYDFVYFSRCVNPLENDKYIHELWPLYVEKFDRVINELSFCDIAISQVVNTSNTNCYNITPFDKEIDLYNFIKNKYNVKLYIGSNMQKCENNIKCYKRGLNYYLYIINKRIM